MKKGCNLVVKTGFLDYQNSNNLFKIKRPHGDSNHGYRRERAITKKEFSKNKNRKRKYFGSLSQKFDFENAQKIGKKGCNWVVKPKQSILIIENNRQSGFVQAGGFFCG